MKNVIVPVITAFVLSAGCSKKTADAPVEAPVTAPEPAVADEGENPDKDPNKASIVVDPKIAEMCEIPTANFDFDSSDLGDDARAALDALAVCFTTGPAKDKGMRLVGHADPRGTEEYNMALGSRRAGSVADYLGGKGIQEANLETSSKGELEAAGTDEATWAADRKVEIFLAE
jgi:peptidoglycan-associated lipoprotein